MGEAAHYHGNVHALTNAGPLYWLVLCYNPCMCVVPNLALQACCNEHLLA